MPSVYHAHLRDLTTPGRFTNRFVCDTRFRRTRAPYEPAQVAASLPTAAGYLHVPALGAQSCSNGDFEPTPLVLNWVQGLGEVTAALPPDTDVVALCCCPEHVGRSHRRLVCRELAAALGFVDGGPLP